MSRPNVSILICTRDRAEDLRQTLDAIGRVRADVAAEVIVIDNASTDQTSNVATAAILANAIPVRCVAETRPGKGYAYNRGMAAARGDVLLFTDDDVRPPADWIDGMSGPILRGEADAVAGGVRLAPHLERPWLTDFLRVWVACTDGIDSDHPTSMVGANMAFSRKVLEKVPAFDPELGPGALGFDDEALFAWQLLEAGCRLVAAPDVAVEHHFSADRLTAEHFVSIARRMGRSRAYVRHHWEHEPVPFPRLQALRYTIDLAIWRLLHPRESQPQTPPAPHRLYSIFRRELALGYLHERRRPRIYARRGLYRLSPAGGDVVTNEPMLPASPVSAG